MLPAQLRASHPVPTLRVLRPKKKHVAMFRYAPLRKNHFSSSLSGQPTCTPLTSFPSISSVSWPRRSDSYENAATCQSLVLEKKERKASVRSLSTLHVTKFEKELVLGYTRPTFTPNAHDPYASHQKTNSTPALHNTFIRYWLLWVGWEGAR